MRISAISEQPQKEWWGKRKIIGQLEKGKAKLPPPPQNIVFKGKVK